MNEKKHVSLRFGRMKAPQASKFRTRISQGLALKPVEAMSHPIQRNSLVLAFRGLARLCMHDLVVERIYACSNCLHAPPFGVAVVGDLLEAIGTYAASSRNSSSPSDTDTSALSALSAPLLTPLSAFISGEEEGLTGTDAGGADTPVAAAARDALGAALRALGPYVVTRVLPLNVKEQLAGVAGVGDVRTWMIPLMRRHVCGAPLGYWGAELLVGN